MRLNTITEVRGIATSVACKGKQDQLRALLQGMLVPTRAESECKSYELYESDSAGRFYFDEIWESQVALDEYIATPHFKHLEQSTGELQKESFEVNILNRILSAK